MRVQQAHTRAGVGGTHRQQRRREAEHMGSVAAAVTVAQQNKLIVIIRKTEKADVRGLLLRLRVEAVLVAPLLRPEDSPKVTAAA